VLPTPGEFPVSLTIPEFGSNSESLGTSVFNVFMVYVSFELWPHPIGTQ
jgi:hypothetical protein